MSYFRGNEELVSFIQIYSGVSRHTSIRLLVRHCIQNGAIRIK